MFRFQQKMHHSVLTLSPVARVLAFVQGTDIDDYKLFVQQAIISMAKGLKKELVAEGVKRLNKSNSC